MKKLKNQLTVIQGRLIISLFAVSLFLIISCDKNNQNNDSEDYNIDLSVKYNNQINSFQIDNEGNSFVLIKETYKDDKYYRVFFDKEEMQHIQKSLKEINYSKCDTIDKIVMDGTQYIFELYNKTRKINVVSGTCEQLKPIDKLVKYIIDAYRKKN